MANKYWYKGTTGADNWSVAANWWSLPGGPTGGGTSGTLPANTDDIIVDPSVNNIGTLNIEAAKICNSFVATGFTGGITGTFGLTLTTTISRGQSASTPLFGLPTNPTTYTYSGTITFGGAATGGGYIYCNGNSFKGPVIFSASTATFTFVDAFKTLSTNTVTLTSGNIVATNAAVEFGTFTQTGTVAKTFNCTNLYLTGTSALYTVGVSTGLTTTITNIYVNNATTTPKTLLFNGQFGSTNLELGGSGNISVALGTTKQPAITVTNTGGTTSVFNITAATTIKSLVFTQPVTWTNDAAITVTIAGNLTLVGGLNITATPNLIFSATATITTAGKSLVTGTLTTNASTTTTIVGVLSSDANIIFNSTVNTNSNVSTTGTLTIGGASNLSGSIISAGALTISGAAASLTAAAGSTITCTGVLTITQGSINAVGALSSLYASSITQTGALTKSITVTGAGSGLYLTGTNALFTNTSGTSTGLTTNITNIYVIEASTAAKTLVFDAQFGSTNISFNGSGNMNFTPGTSKVPNVIVNNPAPASVFNIGATGTIQSLVFNQPIVWNNTTSSVTLTINGSALDLSGITLTANPSLVFPNPVTINLTGKSLVNGSLTTISTATFAGTGITSNAAVTLNGTTGVPGNINTGNAALTIGGVCTFAGTSITAGALNINGTSASILQSSGSAFSVTGSGVFTITQGSLNTNGGTLTVPSITSSGTLTRSITAPAVYLTGTAALYTAGTSGLTTSITNIYVNDGTTTPKTLVFDAQFGSTNLELGGSGSITFTPGTSKVPNVTVTNTGGTNSVFNIGATGTIQSLVFNTPTPITWNNTTTGVTLTINGSALDLSGITLTANPSLVFPNNVTINLTGKTLSAGSLTTNANTTATFLGTGITSNAAVILNGTASVPGNINTGSAALTIGGICTFAGTSITSGALNINGTAASILQIASSLFNVTISGVLTITQGSLNTNGGNLTVLSITSSGALTKSITAPAVYLTGTGTLYTAGTSGLSTSITNIYVTTNTGSARTLTFDTQFGSTDLEFGGSGSGAITFQPGTTFQPNLLISSTGNPTFNISTAGTIKNLIFSASSIVTWSNSAVTVTSAGSLFTLVNGVTIGALGTPSLVFSNNVTITLAGKSLVTGTLTTNATTIFSGSINSSAAVTLNGTTTIQGDINTSAVTLTIGGSCSTGSVSANVLNVTGASANLITSNAGSSINVTGLTTLASGGAINYAGTFTSGSITITNGSFSTAGSSPGILTCYGILTITQGSIYILNASLYASSITQTGALTKSITVTGAGSGLYLTGTNALFTNTATSTGLTTNIINIYVNNASITAKSLIFDTQFGSTNLFFNGSGNITFTPGTFKKPNVTVDNPGGTNSIFNILVSGTIGNLIFITPITWNNTASQTLTVSGTEFTLVSGIVFGANGHSSLVFSNTSNTVTITLAGKTLATGSLTTNANTDVQFDGGINSNAAVTLNGTTSVSGNINTGIAALTIGDVCTFTGTSVAAGALTINGANASILQSTSSAFSVTGSGILTITQGSLNTNGGNLTALSITSVGTLTRSITAPAVYLTGTAALYTAGTSGLSTSITNIYVNNGTTTAKILVFDDQFGSTNLFFNGSGNITFTPGTSKKPNVTVDNPGGTNSIFNILVSGTIGNLIFITPITWNNTLSQILTVSGDTFTLASGIVFGANGHSSLVFSNTSNTVTINLAGKTLATGSLTTNANTNVQFDGGINSNATVTLNGTASVLGDITPAALTIGGACTFTGTLVSATTIAINGANASILQSTSSAFSVTGSGILTITQGSLDTGGGVLTASSITSSGALTKSITAPAVYLTGTGTLYTAASGLTTTVSNIYVTENTGGSARTLTFDTQFGSTDLEFGGSGTGTITFIPGTFFQPNLLISSTGNPTFNISTAGTIKNLIFSNSAVVTWSNAAVIVTVAGSLFTLVSGVTIGALGTPSLAFSNNVDITTAGKSFATGTLTTNANTNVNGVFNSNANVTLNTAGQTVTFSSTFTITGTGVLTIAGATVFFSSTINVPTITINSGTIIASGSISCGGTTTISGDGIINYSGTFTSNAVTINSGNIESNSTTDNITFACTNTFTLASGGIAIPNSVSIGSITVSGSGGKSINVNNLSLTGTGTLFTPGTASNLTTSVPNIYVTNTSVTAKTLSFTTEFGSSSVYLQGTLITFGGGTQFAPNVYVTSTSSSTVSFLTGIFTDLIFSTGTNVTWNNTTAGQIITIYGNLALISTMSTSTTTPTLLFMAGTGSQTIFTAGKTFYVGSLIIDGTSVQILDNFNSNIPVTVQNSGNLYTKGFLTTGLLSILTSATCYTSGSAFSVGTLTLNDGSILLGSTSHTCTGAVTSTGYSNTNSASMDSILNMNSTFAVSGGGEFTAFANINVTGLTTITGGTNLTIATSNTVFSAVTITSGFINISGVGSKYVCTGVTTLTEGDLGNFAGNLYTGTLTLGGGAAAKNIYAPNLYFTGTGALYTHGSGAILSNGPDNIYITDSTNNAKTLLCNTQFPYTTNIPIYLGGSGSGSISIQPGSTFVPVIYVTNTGGANISITGTSATIASLIFANTSNAAWNNGAMTLNIQADLDLGTNPNMTVVATPSIVFNVGPSSIYLNGKTLKGTVDVTAYASVHVFSDFSSTSTVTVTDGFIDVINGNFTATILDIKIAGYFAMRSSGTLNLSSITSTGNYTQYRGNLICTGAISVPGIFYTFIDPLYPGPPSIQCASITGSTVDCNIYFTPKTTVTLTGTGTVWTVPSTAGGVQSLGIIRITNPGANNITFAGGGWIYYELIFDRGTSPNNNIISGSNFFTNFRDLGTAAHSLVLTTGTTQQVGHFDVHGSSGNSIAIARSGTTGVATLTKFPAGLVICDWVTVTNVTAENLNTFYSGPNSTLTNAANWNDGTTIPIGKVRNQSALGAG